MNSPQLSITIRDADAGDISFIFSSWLKSFRNGLMSKHVDNTIYYQEHHKVIEKILKRSKIKIACSADDIANIVGWVCYEHVDGLFVMHYAYVKHVFRNLGVFNELKQHTGHDFQSAGLFTHMTKPAEIIATKVNLIYHPYILLNYFDNSAKDEKREPTA